LKVLVFLYSIAPQRSTSYFDHKNLYEFSDKFVFFLSLGSKNHSIVSTELST